SGKSLSDHYRKGFSYYDCRVKDARLTVLNAIDARNRGSGILTYTVVTGLEAEDGVDGKVWRIDLFDTQTGKISKIRARSVVNAGGPWVHSILKHSGLAEGAPNVRMVQGSHIIVPKIYDEPQAYTLQQPDGRVVFTIPYESGYTLIGTTDE